MQRETASSQLAQQINKADSLVNNRAELIKLIRAPESPRALEILQLADALRESAVGNGVYLRGLIEFSNYCRNNCNYCGLRRDNRKVPRYRLTPAEIIQTATHGLELGYQTIVLQSGEDPWFTGERLAEIIREIKQLGVVVTLSAGERDPADYELWRQAGAERYLMRHETADPLLYQQLHPGQSLGHRVKLLKILKGLDYQVGTGFMVGLPGQTAETLIADLELVQELQAEMVGIGPFIPHPETPLANTTGGTLAQTVLMVALTRLVLPMALIPATTALGSIDPLGREKALQAGANIMMPNLTPQEHRAEYEIYPNKICLAEAADHCRGCIASRIESVGRQVAQGPGHNREWLRRRQNV